MLQAGEVHHVGHLLPDGEVPGSLPMLLMLDGLAVHADLVAQHQDYDLILSQFET